MRLLFNLFNMPKKNIQHHSFTLQVTYSHQVFMHSHSTDIHKNVHIVTAYSDCDSSGLRAECQFRVIAKGQFVPGLFSRTTCTHLTNVTTNTQLFCILLKLKMLIPSKIIQNKFQYTCTRKTIYMQ